MTTAPLRQTDRKREAIIQAAISEFRSQGFDATSMDKIAATAEVSKRTVYNHFPSKEDLFTAILLQLWKSAAAQNELTYQHERPLKEQLVEFLKGKMRMCCDVNFIDLVRVAVAATIHTPDRARDMVEKLNNQEGGIVAWIKAAQADGKLKAGDPNLMGDMLQGQLKAVAFWPQIGMGQAMLSAAQQKQVIQLTADMFLLYYAKT
ncbi:MAG: TetR/AcrR family transcriptional regulator [Burkholderiales bacterium]|nr:TetR/AcrR family transcriptional regulator [Burkholderiales bacterium]